ncbi:hypothetical protein ACET3Z_018235 [Daucus carota]
MITEDLLKISSNQAVSFGEEISGISNSHGSFQNEEVDSSCTISPARDDMRIQTIGPEINGMKCYEMKDVKMKDKLFKVEVSRTHANCSCVSSSVGS